MASPPDPRLPEPWRQLARLSSRAGLPRSPGSGQAGGRGLGDPSPGSPACPIHLNKLWLTGAQSPWSRSPVVSLVPITQHRVWPTGWGATGDAGRVGSPTFFLVTCGPSLEPVPAAGALSRQALGSIGRVTSCVAHCVPSRLMRRRGPAKLSARDTVALVGGHFFA